MSLVKKTSKCLFFPACGGCLYLSDDEDEYRKIKISALLNLLKEKEIIFNEDDLNNNSSKEILDNNFLNKNVDFFWIGGGARRKITLQIDAKNNLGFFAKSSNNLVEIDSCYIANQEISALILHFKNLLQSFENHLITQIAITNFDNVIDVVFCCKRELNFFQQQKILNWAKALKINASWRLKNKITPIFIQEVCRLNFKDNISLELDSEIFIQATKGGLDKISHEITNFIASTFKKKIIAVDIYSGFGAYSFAISSLVQKVYAFEGSKKMVDLINKNSAKNLLKNKIIPVERDLVLHPISEKELQEFDLAIINPPRNGAASQIAKISKSKLNYLIYVSCNPKSFAQDAATLFKSGFKISRLLAIDQFYGSEHLELVSIFVRFK